MITNVIIILTIVIVGGVFILDHFAIEREKNRNRKPREKPVRSAGRQKRERRN